MNALYNSLHLKHYPALIASAEVITILKQSGFIPDVIEREVENIALAEKHGGELRWDGTVFSGVGTEGERVKALWRCALPS